MIEFHDVHASYDANTPILKGVSLRVDDGEFVAFVGTNGAGKSTTMRLVNGLLKPEAGEVLIDGVPTTQLKTSELARRVGFLFQNPDSQICCNTVREELLFGFRAIGKLDSAAEARVDAVIESFGFNPDDDPFLLNRGTRQLLALASIVVLDTPVIVLDEPTTGLDFRECVKVMDIIANLHASGTTVIMVCHDMEVVSDFAERVIVMSDGRVVAQGPTFEVLRNRHTLEIASLVPPQIVDISIGLSLMNPALRETAIGHANTLNEMQSAVEASLGSPRISGMLGRPSAVSTPSKAPGAQELAGQVGYANLHLKPLPEDESPGRGMAPGTNLLADFDLSEVTSETAAYTGSDDVSATEAAEFERIAASLDDAAPTSEELDPNRSVIDVTSQIFHSSSRKQAFVVSDGAPSRDDGTSSRDALEKGGLQ